ncbi:hypothetical protein E2C01_007535 [Portunus trituberculatus]|uniref:Uncharacterized protein n=1 Tax=Portunus trituberculatus TaxID=210409 RepID=A0A5B7CYF0_PORTR|nr:hypothetical protein [Portunus trituberculatus]
MVVSEVKGNYAAGGESRFTAYRLASSLIKELSEVNRKTVAHFRTPQGHYIPQQKTSVCVGALVVET